MMDLVNADMIWRLRQRGLIPMGDKGQFTTPRLKEIVKRLAEVSYEMAQLDQELKDMAEAENLS